MRSTTLFIGIVALVVAARGVAAQECITTSLASETEAAVTEFQVEPCSNVGQSTQSILASASSTISSTTSNARHETSTATTTYNEADPWGVPSSIPISYTPTTAATASATRSSNAAVSVNTVALWQPVLGLIVGYVILFV
ncbi:hypothetical protein FS837_010275 [Tulasnella sp. UAMH 9824]|nr:hypothetical protein FS837_010275 [Tulasnella sp. UAMH 9824]